jgi:hypothetical protein
MQSFFCLFFLLSPLLVASNNWFLLVDQSARGATAGSVNKYGTWCDINTCGGTPIVPDIDIDLSGTTSFIDSSPRIAGSLADDFPIPLNHSCNKLYVALDAVQFFSSPGNIQNPTTVQFGILQDDDATHATPALNQSAVIWIDNVIPVGNWTNMTNFANGQFQFGRMDMAYWFELDLSSLNNGQGIVGGRYWLVMTVSIDANLELADAIPNNPNSGQHEFYNFFGAFMMDNYSFPNISVYGADAVRPDVPALTFVTSDGYSGGWSNDYCTNTAGADAAPYYVICGISMRIFGWCTSDGTESNIFTEPVPSPLCNWSTPAYLSNANWSCPAARQLPGQPSIFAPPQVTIPSPRLVYQSNIMHAPGVNISSMIGSPHSIAAQLVPLVEKMFILLIVFYQFVETIV